MLAIALAALQAAPALAADEDNLPSERIAIGDLNLDTAEGRATLNRRVAGAAKRVCSAGVSPAILSERSEQRACFGAAIAGASSQVGRILAARNMDGGILVSLGRDR